MAKFNAGQKVIWIKHNEFGVGTILDNDQYPDVKFESDILCMDEDELQLYIDPASEISKIINQSLDRENSWDDSVEISESMDLPVDKFEFRYTDEYGRQLSHVFKESEGIYGLEDVIASFRLFLLGCGYDREDVDEIIDESRL